MIRCAILMILATYFVAVFANWEPVPLDDKTDFDIRCIYKAKCFARPGIEWPISTKFFNVSNKKIGYLPNVSGKMFNAYIMADSKTVFTFKTAEGRFIKNWQVIELKKKCLPNKLEVSIGQKNSETKVPDKSSLDDFYAGAHFFVE